LSSASLIFRGLLVEAPYSWKTKQLRKQFNWTTDNH